MMTESVVAPQSFTGASNFDIANSVFIASTNTTLTSALPQISDASRLSPKPSLFIPPLPSDESEAEWEVYARLLLPRKRGYPLWDPKPREGGLLPEEYRQSGVQIGDVGILNDSGGFDYLFNVCLPPSHPVNAGRVPPNFEQLRGIVVRDTAGDAEKYRPGDYVPSDASHIHKTKITYRAGEQAILGVHKDFGAGVSFKSSATKGAFLILPEGASSIDHQQHTLFYQYAARCARSWYTYVNGPLARGVHNGSLYLVTGCDKARAWGVASFIGAQPDNVALEFVPREPDRAGGPLEYWFSTCTSALSSSNADNVYKRQSGCVFLRGFKIAVKNPVLAPFSKIAAKVTPLSHLSPDDLLSKPRLSANLATTNATSKQGWLSFLSPGHWTSNLADNGINSEFPIRYEEYHPSNVIDNWILSHSDVEVSITHDDDWASLIHDGEAEVPDNEELIHRIRQTHKLIKFGTYATIVGRIGRKQSSVFPKSNVEFPVLTRRHSEFDLGFYSHHRVMPQHELELSSRRIASHPTNDPSSDIGASSGSITSIRGSSSHLDMHDVELIWSERIKLTNTTSEPSTLGLGYHGNRALMDPKELSTLVNASHSTLPKPATKTTRTKNQIRMACTFCRARKIACSPGDPDVENGPCNQCQKRGQKCVPYSTRDSSHGGQDHIGIKEAVVDAGVKMAMMSIDPRISSDNIKENDSYVSSSKWEPLNES